jgi:hypothetical protein
VFNFPKPDDPRENLVDKNLLRKYRVRYFQGIKTASKFRKNEKEVIVILVM